MKPASIKPDRPSRSPFDLQQDDAYQRWREHKLSVYPVSPEALIVEVSNPLALAVAERQALHQRLRQTNMAVYASRTNPAGKEIPRAVGAQFGLHRLGDNLLADEDAISSVQVMPHKSGRGYIPYSNQRLLWHTDGYYNEASRPVRAFILHCVSPAASGGINRLIDPEILYIRLRDESPELVRSLMAADAMTIPANEESAQTRAAVTGPVFSVSAQDGALHMRYTARTRSIAWRDDSDTRAAVERVRALLDDPATYGIDIRLTSGQGLLCNNVLHSRTAFTDDMDSGQVRLLYRARYHDRITDTGPQGFGA